MANPLARFGAFIIDYLILSAVIVILYIVYYALQIAEYVSPNQYSKLFFYIVVFFIMIIFFLLQWAYFIFFEMLLNGKSVGKILFRIRVIKYDGSFFDFNSSVLRNFIRVFDFNFTGGWAALIVMVINKDFRRLGDITANTVVVKDPDIRIKLPDFTVKNLDINKIENAKLTKKLSEKDLYIIRTFLNSESTINSVKRIEIANKIVYAIKKKLSDESETGDPVDYLKKIYAGHHNER